jgi:hypothetical protein
MAMAILGAPLFGQTEEPVDKVSVELEFNASALAVTITDDATSVDSFADSDVGDSTLGFSYEDELWGGSVSLAFASETLRFLSLEAGEGFAEPVLSLDELYAWVKPFGPVVKFTGGIFENTDGIADYTDDIDEFGMGVFWLEDGHAVEPVAEYTSPVLANGFLTDIVIGPATLQLLFSSNFAGESASALSNDLVVGMYQLYGLDPGDADNDGIPDYPIIDTDERFFRLGGRVIVDAGVGTFSAMFKTFQYPIETLNAMMAMAGATPYDGTKVNWTTFGGYFDYTGVENLGVSVGYTGFLQHNDNSDVDNVLFSGIDLRGTWTGIEGLSLSTHNNVSFASGKEKDWSGMLGKDQSFFSLYNAIGATKELNDKFSVNAVLSNFYEKFAFDADNKMETNTFGIGAKCIVKVAENTEFNVGAEFATSTVSITGADSETATTFSIPVGISLKF